MFSNYLNREIKGLLIDISGVLKDGSVPITQSISAIQTLLDHKIPFRLLTNETQLSKNLLFQHLKEIGFPIPSSSFIIQPAPLLANYLLANGSIPKLLVHKNSIEDFSELLKKNETEDCLVIGDAEIDFTYNALNDAFQFLIDNPSAKFYSLGKGKYYKEDGKLKLDLGAYTTALEFATGKKAEIWGKPSLIYFQHALEELGLDPESVVMIGDDVEGDIGGAQMSGLRGILVKTGKYQQNDEYKTSIKPDGLVTNFSEAVNNIISKFYSK